MLGCGQTTNPRNHNPKQTASPPATLLGKLSCLQEGSCMCRLKPGIRDCNSTAETSHWRWHKDGCQLEGGGCNLAKLTVAVTQSNRGQCGASHPLLAAAAWKGWRGAAAETAPASLTTQKKASAGSRMASSWRSAAAASLHTPEMSFEHLCRQQGKFMDVLMLCLPALSLAAFRFFFCCSAHSQCVAFKVISRPSSTFLHPGELKHKPLAKLGKPLKPRALYPITAEVCKKKMAVIRKWIIKVILPCPYTKHITLTVHLVCSIPSNHFHLPLSSYCLAATKIKASRKSLKKANGCVQSLGKSFGARLVCRGGMTRGSNEAEGRCRAVRRVGRCQKGWSLLSLPYLTSN